MRVMAVKNCLSKELGDIASPLSGLESFWMCRKTSDPRWVSRVNRSKMALKQLTVHALNNGTSTIRLSSLKPRNITVTKLGF
jgi:hypothetical protein